MEVIQKLSGKSYGGVKCNKIELLPIDWAETIPDIGNNAHLAEITLGSGKYWTEINARRNSIQFTEAETSRNGAKVYVSQIKFQVARDYHETILKMQRMGRRGFFIRFTDKNNNKKLMGAVKFPARLTFSRDNKSIRTETNEIDVLLRCVNRLPVAGYNYS